MELPDTKTAHSEIFRDWNRNAWLLVLLYAFIIFSFIPLVRPLRKAVSESIGREYFSYSVIFIVICGSAALVYSFIFRLKVKKLSQYVWIVACAGLYIYFTNQLKRWPEEAIHLVEYGLLSYFVFKALQYRITDRTIYITTILIVAFIGTIDEVIQWMIPKRYWDFRDVGTNVLGGAIFQLGLWQGIRPEVISKPLKSLSVKLLSVVLTFDLILLGLCLSNTPKAVNWYTQFFQSLLWLRAEEPMSKAGSPKMIWALILISLIIIWGASTRWIKKLK